MVWFLCIEQWVTVGGTVLGILTGEQCSEARRRELLWSFALGVLVGNARAMKGAGTRAKRDEGVLGGRRARSLSEAELVHRESGTSVWGASAGVTGVRGGADAPVGKGGEQDQ